MRFDKNAVAIRAGDGIVLDDVFTRTTLQHDAARVTAGTDGAVAPRAVPQIVRRRVFGNFTVLHIVKMDPPRAVAVRGVAAHNHAARIADINSRRAVVGAIVFDERVRRGTNSHSAAFGQSEKLSKVAFVRVAEMIDERVIVNV